MPGVPREFAEHHLNVDPKAKPVQQYLRRFNVERRKAIGEEVARLLAARFIVEVLHPKWLANPVLVLKKNGTFRMCIDYTDLNRACPKDPFALPRIDQIIDSVAGCERLCFLDAYSGYHQIKMAVEDQEKTAFITLWGFLLCVHAVRTQECRGDLSALHPKLPPWPNRTQCPRLCR